MSDYPYSVSTLAERWGCSPRHIRNLVRKGDLKGFRVGNLLRFTVGEVEAYECGGATRESVRREEVLEI